MEKISSKKDGFTLLEVVISMMLITILSVGVYNAYIMIIRHTKGGQVKQEAALVGKRIVEEIKAETGNIKKNDDGDLELTINNSPITLYKNEEKYSTASNNPIDLDGYECEISLEPKMTEDHKDISIGEDHYIQYKNVLVNDNMMVQSQSKNILNLVISADGTSYKIKDTDFNIDSNSIVLNFKNYIDNATIEVTNESTTTLNLYILNSKYNTNNKRNVTVENKQGSLNEYYRADYEGKIGTLYNITVNVSRKDSKGQEVNNLFESSFVQNIDTN
ncbi:MAG: prepilin-type N-terminal cleavage/methylation domain-containing protein [Clostridium butyricum]|nr:prepilin-type N-terminal cleavage/methylation domain-containing protein [Clostridium butyricum]MDU5819882.1 prepilin-type N-terminal cleavage/methylation domain-containing protein [Clostridium butyricum]